MKTRLLFLPVLALCLLVIGLAACSGEESSGGVGGVAPETRPFDTPAPGTQVAGKQVIGLFFNTRALKTTAASLPAKPASPFPASDRRSVAVYDTQSGKHTDFGPGTVVAPAFNNNRLVYTAADNEAWLVDLATMQKRSLGAANLVYWVDDNRVLVVAFQQRNMLLNINTGSRELASSLSDTLITDQEAVSLGGPLRRRLVLPNFVLRYAVDVEKLIALKCRFTPTPEGDLCGLRFREEFIVDNERGLPELQFRALQSFPAGKDEIIIATSPRCEDGNGKQIWCDEVLLDMETKGGAQPVRYAKGSSNIFIVNVTDGRSRFIATAAYDPPTGIRTYNWPLAADENYVVWTENYCGQSRGKTKVFDRRSGQVRELDQTLWVTLKGGLIGVGEFGPRAFIDPATLQYKAVLPENVPDPHWSPDNRYAAVGQASAHGGYCG